MPVQVAAKPPQSSQQSAEAAVPLHVIQPIMPLRLIQVGRVVQSKQRPTFLKFPNELYTLVVQGYGGSLGSHRNWLYATIDSHKARGHKIYVHCVLPNDPLHVVSKWESFSPAHEGYATFNADVSTYKSLLLTPGPNQLGKVVSHEMEQTANVHSNVHPTGSVQCLWELGDHADDKIAQQSLVRKRAPEIEQVYEDCGDDVCAIEVTGEESMFCDMHTHDNLSDYSDDESNCTLNADHLLWYMMGSSYEPSNNPKAEIFATFSAAFPALKARQRKPDVVEVFGGNGGVLKMAVGRGLTPGRNFDLVSGVDLSHPKEVALLIEYIAFAEPFCVVLAPPCTAFGSWSNYNQYHAFEAWSESLRVGLPLANLAARIATIQMAAGRHFITENPWSSALWKLPSWLVVLKDSRVRVAYIDQCMYGLKDMNHEFSKKPTAIVASHELLVRFLQLRCTGQHTHSPLAGTIRGVSKTAFAQTWPLALCQAIIKGICALKKFYDQQSQSYRMTAYPVETICPGCKQHASRGDSRHNRGPACKFPYDDPEVWKCLSCVKHQHVHNSAHTRIVGECKWGTASSRTTSKRSKDPRVPVVVVDEADPDKPDDLKEPPPTVLGKWQPLTLLRLISDLEEIKSRDGWHKLSAGPALVSTDSRDLRGPEPRFYLESLPRRSVYGFWPEFSTEFGNWWQLQNNAPADRPGNIGYKVPILVHIFHPADVVDAPGPSPIKIKPDNKDGPPQISQTKPYRDLMQQWDDEEPAIRRVPHKFPWDKQPVVDRAEGEEEPEPQSLDAAPVAGAEVTPVPDWSSWDLGKALRVLRGSSTPMHVRTIRQLHLRWWHCPAARLQALLCAAGLPPEIVKLAQSVVDTCRVCRLWQRPGDKAIASSRLSLEFNASVQCDLLFWGEVVVLHMCDECTRFSMAQRVSGKKA